MKPRLPRAVILLAAGLAVAAFFPEPQRTGPPPNLPLLAQAASPTPAGPGAVPLPEPELRIVDRRIVFNEERKALTREYLQNRYGLVQDNIEITPRMIVIHWTAGPSLEGAFAVFDRVRLGSSRPELTKYGDLNVSAQFLVDRDGTVYRLMEETWMARHTIGLNWCAIGVENVGDGGKYALTAAQLEADAALVRYLKRKYPKIEYLIGHHEYGRFKNTPLWKEMDPAYFTRKSDPGDKFMSELRARVADLGLQDRWSPPAPE